MILAEHAIDVFEGAVCSFRVEEVDGGDEGEVEDGPDDVEFPVEALDAYGCDFDDYTILSAILVLLPTPLIFLAYP